jgi:hypothetical protein
MRLQLASPFPTSLLRRASVSATARVRALPAATAVALDRDAVRVLHRQEGWTELEVRDGTLWLTGTPGAHDVLLTSGSQIPLDYAQPLVLQALGGPATFVLHR